MSHERKVTPMAISSGSQHDFDDLHSNNYLRPHTVNKYVEQRRQLKANIIQELLRATIPDIEHFSLDHYMVGRGSRSRSGNFRKLLRALGLAELTCQEAVVGKHILHVQRQYIIRVS